MDYQHWLRRAINQLSHSESPRRDAEILLGFVTGKTRTYILAFGETALSDRECEQLDDLLARRERVNRSHIWWAFANSGLCRCLSRLRR
jgi:release factor glutamine methyltransferase